MFAALDQKLARYRELEQQLYDTAVATNPARSGVIVRERGAKIRTYHFKENRVTDHRIGLTLYKLDRVLGDGELDELIDALTQDERARQLQDAGDAER